MWPNLQFPADLVTFTEEILKGATKLSTKVIFVSGTKIGENITNILKLLNFTINLHLFPSNQIPTYLCFVFLPLEMQNWLEQTKIYHVFSYFVWKETTHKPLQVPAAKTLLSSVYVISTTCFDDRFPFYVITGRHCF